MHQKSPTRGKATRTYTGGTRIEAGKLVLAADSAASLSTGDVTIANGATLDLNGALSTANSGFANVYAEGTGVDGNGAIANTGAAHVNKWFAGALYLTGDLLVNSASRFDIGNIYPQGHTFRVNGTGASAQSVRVGLRPAKGSTCPDSQSQNTPTRSRRSTWKRAAK